jgi:hypothetical protein
VGLDGRHDGIHLSYRIETDRVCLTRNYDDFAVLHNLILKSGGHHSGILVVRRDNDPQRNLKVHDIVRAIGKLLAAGMPIVNQYLVLNQWK